MHTNPRSTQAFSQQLARYKQLIEADIEAYGSHIKQSTATAYGQYPAAVADVYFDLLQRGGKRIRGALVMAGYEMCGGTDERMITRAATALEMIHAYILIMDDIQDRSVLRRGKPTAHEMLAAYHRKQGLSGDAAHAGVALAINAALAGNHAAQMLLSGLQVEDELKIKVLGIVNYTMVTTAHGQTTDIINELATTVSDADIVHTLEWKTAHYTVLNPLCTGMVLAGAGCEDTDAIRDYALHVGKAFQITDDILGVFGSPTKTGKRSGDDIKEGKKTVLTQYALGHASPDEQLFLKKCLGNQEVTDADLQQCQKIIKRSGALGNASDMAKHHSMAALDALAVADRPWKPDQVAFLEGLAQTIISRSA